MEGRTLKDAATLAEMSESTARRWRSGEQPSDRKQPRHWRTRPDPFEQVWSSEIVPLLEADEDRKLQAKTIMADLVERRPDEFDMSQLRTLQRRVRDWRALYGAPQEVMFEQEHPPGREGAFDFTDCCELGVTIGGVTFAHLLFTFTLSFSGWTRVSLAFSETFEALLACLQDALWTLGGVPSVVRHDNLSAATRELKSAGRSLTKRFKEVLEHYRMDSTRITPGRSHENGTAEQSNFRVKEVLEQALILRGHRDFESEEAYIEWVRQVVDRGRNTPKSRRIEAERCHLQPLPARPLPNYTVWHPTVRKWSTIRVGKYAYSVPSRLRGHTVEVRQYANHLEVVYNDKVTESFPRLRGRTVRIDYRHVIWSLVRKPGAFARYRFREELFPTLTFRRAYDAFVGWYGERADIEYVRVLHLAASTMETTVGASLTELLEGGSRFDYAAVKALADPEPRSVPNVQIPPPDLTQYERLLAGGA
jgi:hypothetical protein